MKNCPRCNLSNPDDRTWCLCGNEFPSVPVIGGLTDVPWTIWLFTAITGLGLLVRLYRYAGLRANRYAWELVGKELQSQVIASLVWASITVVLLVALLHRKNWARLGLVVWTFPLGLILAFSKSARRYTQATTRTDDGKDILGLQAEEAERRRRTSA